MRNIIFLLSCFFISNLHGQNSDCNTALLLSDTIYQQIIPPFGYGKVKELVQPKKYDFTSFKSEKNSEWFILKQTEKVSLTLSIIPMNVNDDYDFMIFDA